MNDEQAQQLGEYIKNLRNERNMNTRQLAERAGLDDGGLNRLERGVICKPKPTTLCAIAKALDVSATDMFALAGYTVPQDLPSIEHYLKVKYDCIPEDEAWEICQTVKRIAHIYGENPVPRTMTNNEPDNRRGDLSCPSGTRKEDAHAGTDEQ